MKKKEWFVLQTLVGKEGKVVESVNARVRLEDMGEYIGQVVIPTEKVTESKNGKKKVVTRKIFPGYVLMEMAFYDYERGIDPATRKKAVEERTWNFLAQTPGLIGTWLRNLPTPMSQAELEAIFSNKPAQATEKPKAKIPFKVEDTVKINEGPFMGLTGLVSVVDPDRGKLKVEVNVFSRKVPVDVDYWQVELASSEEKVEGAPSQL